MEEILSFIYELFGLKQVLEDGIKLRNNIYDFNPCCIEEFRGIQKIKERLII
jgi:hypothetical protein